jgi:ribosome-associated protein
MCLKVTPYISIPLSEIDIQAIRAQGAGGQNVNKVSSAIHLRFDIDASSLPRLCKDKLLRLSDQRITNEGVIVIKAQQHRTQEKNKLDALDRLRDFIRSVTIIRKKRKATRPTLGSQKKRMDRKTKRGRIKKARGRVDIE